MKHLSLFAAGLYIILVSCNEGNRTGRAQKPVETPLAAPKSARPPAALALEDTVYVPVYSEIVNRNEQHHVLLTVLLSLRNTSFREKIFIRKVEYYDTEGKLVRTYLPDGQWLGPMQSARITIDKTDNTGGHGANFVVFWGASQTTRPLFQAIMILADGPRTLSFTTEGVSMNQSQKNPGK